MSTALLRFAGASFFTVAGVCAAAAYPVARAAGNDGLVSMAIAAGLTLVGAVAGAIPLVAARDAAPDQRVQAAMIGLAVRMLATLAGVAIVVFLDLAPHRTAFLACSAALY